MTNLNYTYRLVGGDKADFGSEKRGRIIGLWATWVLFMVVIGIFSVEGNQQPVYEDSFILKTLYGNRNLAFGDGIADPRRASLCGSTFLHASGADLYIVDSQHYKIRKFNGLSRDDGRLSTVIGSGTKGFSPDGMNALDCRLGGLFGVAYSTDTEQLFFVDNSIVRVLNREGTIKTIDSRKKINPMGLAILGNNIYYVSNDRRSERVEIMSVNVENYEKKVFIELEMGSLNYPPHNSLFGIHVKPIEGGLVEIYLSDLSTGSIFKVRDGKVTNLVYRSSGDMGMTRYGLTMDSADRLFFAQQNETHSEVCYYSPEMSGIQILSTPHYPMALGTGNCYFYSEILEENYFSSASGFEFDEAGNLYVADSKLVKQVTPYSIKIVAGSLSDENSQLALLHPTQLVAHKNQLYILDEMSCKKVNLSNLETNQYEYLLEQSGSNEFRGITIHNSRIYLSNFKTHQILVLFLDGKIEYEIGQNSPRYSGDGSSFFKENKITFNGPSGLAAFENSLYIADSRNHRIRVIDLNTGIISTIAGSGVMGYSGDGGPALKASMRFPRTLAVDPSSGSLFVFDSGNYRIRKIQKGIIYTIAGNGKNRLSTDNSNSFSSIGFISQMKFINGSLIFAEQDFGLIRKLDAIYANCQKGWFGEYCNITTCFGIHSNESSVCSGQGRCSFADNCECFEGHGGRRCDMASCFGLSEDDVNVCSGRGVCSSADNCICDPDYHFGGPNCNVSKCGENDASSCSGRGVCIGPNICNCTQPNVWGGSSCEVSVCNSVMKQNECSGHGVCSGSMCTCNQGWSGPQCQYALCSGISSNQTGIVCNGHGSCISPENCKCEHGYQSSSCSPICFSKIASDSNVCSSHGECIAVNTCKCREGWTGSQCEIFTCFGMGAGLGGECSSHGSCLGINNCSCNVGYTGLECSSPICFGMDDTKADVCSGNGECISPDVCSCFTHYEGELCEISFCFDVSSINPNVCSGNGKCLKETCQCDDGWNGENCEITSCHGIYSNNREVCNDHGQCLSPENCTCRDGWIGSQCETLACFKVAYDNSSVCSGRGSCISGDTCYCDKNYSGEKCQFSTCFGFKSNSPNVCNNHGECIDNDKCKCNLPFVGSGCEDYMCEGIPSLNTTIVCSGRGRCLLNGIQPYCECNNGYIGSNCETPTCSGKSSTDPTVCNERGACLSPNNCTCKDGYFGNDCEDFLCNGKSATYDPSVCNGLGVCIDIDNCTCNAGVLGKYCENIQCFGFSYDDPKVCSGSGNCSDGKCSCFNQFYGDNCEFKQCSESSIDQTNTCSRRGNCTINGCICENYYGGFECQQKCSNADCSVNKTLCADGKGFMEGSVCTCFDGYYGSNCELFNCFGKIRNESGVCNSHGICKGPDNCECSSGYYGSSCDGWACKGLDKFSPDVCNGHGRCSRPNFCICDKGYLGINCEMWKCYNLPLKTACNNHGKCVAPDDCSCDQGYTGQKCQEYACFGVSYSEKGVVCSGHGNCTSADVCKCEEGFIGEQCIGQCFGINSTESQVCSGNGQCTSKDHCSCKDGWEGPQCQIPKCFNILATDTDNVCSGHGNCTGPNNCSCIEGYGSTNCRFETCFGKTELEGACSNRGKCSNQTCFCTKNFAGEECSKCKDLFTGGDCTIPICNGIPDGDKHVCNTLGKCITDPNGNPMCSCNEGYGGLNCELLYCFGMESTDPLLCSGHGKCTSPNTCTCDSGFDSAYNCSKCLPNRTGPYCNVTICSDEITCNSHGKCNNDLKCECLGVWKGIFCNECSEGLFGPNCDITCDSVKNCSRRGSCSESGLCKCDNHRSGDRCESCADGWYGENCNFMIDQASFTFSENADSIYGTVFAPKTRNFNCSELVSNSQILGDSWCFVNSQKNVMKIMLGRKTTINLNDVLFMRTFYNSSETLKVPISTQQYKNKKPIAIIISDKDKLSGCESINIDGSNSISDFMPLNFNWSVVSTPSKEDGRYLARIIQGSGGLSSLNFEAKKLHGSYTLKLTVTNMFSSQEDSIYYTFTVIDVALPSININEGTIIYYQIGSLMPITPMISFPSCYNSSLPDKIEYLFESSSINLKQKDNILVLGNNFTNIEKPGVYDISVSALGVSKFFKVIAQIQPLLVDFSIGDLSQSSEDRVEFTVLGTDPSFVDEAGTISLTCKDLKNSTQPPCLNLFSSSNQIVVNQTLPIGFYLFSAEFKKNKRLIKKSIKIQVLDKPKSQVVRMFITSSQKDITTIDPTYGLTLQPFSLDTLSLKRVYEWNKRSKRSVSGSQSKYLWLEPQDLSYETSYTVSLDVSDSEMSGSSSLTFYTVGSVPRGGIEIVPTNSTPQEFEIKCGRWFSQNSNVKYEYYFKDAQMPDFVILSELSDKNNLITILPQGTWTIMVIVSDSISSSKASSTITVLRPGKILDTLQTINKGSVTIPQVVTSLYFGSMGVSVTKESKELAGSFITKYFDQQKNLTALISLQATFSSIISVLYHATYKLANLDAKNREFVIRKMEHYLSKASKENIRCTYGEIQILNKMVKNSYQERKPEIIQLVDNSFDFLTDIEINNLMDDPLDSRQHEGINQYIYASTFTVANSYTMTSGFNIENGDEIQLGESITNLLDPYNSVDDNVKFKYKTKKNLNQTLISDFNVEISLNKNKRELNGNESIAIIRVNPNNQQKLTVNNTKCYNDQGRSDFCEIISIDEDGKVKLSLKSTGRFQLVYNETIQYHTSPHPTVSSHLPAGSKKQPISNGFNESLIAIPVIIIALLFMIVMITVAVVLMMKRKNKRRFIRMSNDVDEIELPYVDARDVFIEEGESTSLKTIPIEEMSLLGKIGSGGFGSVYKASYHQRIVAVKTLNTEEEDDYSQRQFLSEANLMSKLQHPNIVSCLGISQRDKDRLIVLEYIEGGSLQQLIADLRRGLRTCSIQQKVSYLIDVASGMRYLHKLKPRPIIHRDLKPGNILIDGENRCKICDFGLSRTFSKHSVSNALTNNIGTYHYMPNEMISADDSLLKVEFATAIDVYSFSVLAWELIFEDNPYLYSQKEKLFFESSFENSEYKNLNGYNVVQKVLKGLRPVIPITSENCGRWCAKFMPASEIPPKILSKAMLALIQLIEYGWNPKPSLRPSFQDILKQLQLIKLKLEGNDSDSI